LEESGEDVEDVEKNEKSITKEQRNISTDKEPNFFLKSNENSDVREGPDNRKDKKPKIGKNPFVETYFLPDKEREDQEQREREELARQWKLEQESLKNENINITYSYWDGSGHRRMITLKKGTTVAHFLDKVREEFRDLRGVSVDGLMFIKEDLIIPHNYSFYDLILMKARGKSGPLFHFDVHDDVRLVNDATLEKDESHAGKVVERRWYERNKHIFPASRWEVFDPNKTYEKYTIHGGEIN